MSQRERSACPAATAAQPPPGLLQVEVEVQDGAVLVRAAGEVDLATWARFAAALDEGVEELGEGAELVLDLRALTFVDGRGARTIARTAERATERGAHVRLWCGPDLDDLLRLLGIPLESTVPAASEEYAHLAQLFVERARLPAGHPRRRVLRDALITGYLPVAQHIARRFRNRGENPDDIEQVAAVGLINAVDRFEVGRGVDFLAFAVPTITGEVQRHHRDRVATIRVPRRVRGLQAVVLRAVDELRQRDGAAPRPSEIARHLDLDVTEVIEALDAVHRAQVASLDEGYPEDEGSGDNPRFAAALAVRDPDVGLVVDRESVGPLLEALPERERRILLLRFYGNKTQSEIAGELGISQMHVSRLLAATLGRLRTSLNRGADPPA